MSLGITKESVYLMFYLRCIYIFILLSIITETLKPFESGIDDRLKGLMLIRPVSNCDLWMKNPYGYHISKSFFSIYKTRTLHHNHFKIYNEKLSSKKNSQFKKPIKN